MKSLNFEILRTERSVIADLGGFAEHYAYSDPSSALVKLRSLAEQLTKAIYWELRLEKPEDTEFAKRLTAPSFRKAVPEVICTKLHAIRKEGNKAAHGGLVEKKNSLWILQESYEVASWFAVSCLKHQLSDIKPYQKPIETPEDTSKLEDEKKSLEEKLAAAVAELETKTADYEALEVKAETKEQGQKTADALHYSEAETRKRLIDVALAEVGWDVTKPNLVTLEEEVAHQPTTTGIGYIDYVLWNDDGKPLAVVEAKKTAQSEERGRKQAELYAHGLEKKYGVRPIIFYTNGYNIWIWDDAQGYPPRKLFGFYAKSSLQNLVNFQRKYKQELNTLSPKAEIAGRIYQQETIKRVCEDFTNKRRKVLIVQATGTGKTRVAIALSELLVRAKWAKRVLFLCDRRELVKQAKNAFNDYMNDPLTVVSKKTVEDNKSRIFVATYPSMTSIFQAFDVGFFDLIIADESHRSIYNRYRDLFRYFDCHQVGLTATPVGFISRNTYKLFECKPDDPTAFYSLEQAVEDKFLVPYEVYSHTTKFLREGIKYEELTPEQRQQLEDDGEDATLLNHDASTIDKQIFNKGTNRLIIRNLMENGIRDASGQLPGKSIIFARRHEHAILLQHLFDEMYPQYGGKFCQVIDNHDPRAEQLIDDFKGLGTNPDLTIAISVDMLDTGIDVPEIVNLVFAKPIKSKVKFWQMIGRGTRLCLNLFGPAQHKTIFRIFDHWNNFEYFEQNKPEAEPSKPTSLMQSVFLARLELATTALNAPELETFNNTVKLLEKDVASLPNDSISVKEKWQEVQTVQQDGVIEHFSPATRQLLLSEIAPLMQWINIRGHSEAYSFDLLMTRMQIAFIHKTNAYDDLRGDLINAVNRLRMNLNPVKEKAATIKQVKDPAFWDGVDLDALETIRTELRSIMQYTEGSGVEQTPAKVVDIDEDENEVQSFLRSSGIVSIDQAAYRERVEAALRELFDQDPTLQKIRKGEAVSEADLERLVSLVLTKHPDVDLHILSEFYPNLAQHLDVIIRSIIGMDEDAVKDRFQTFVQNQPKLSANQTKFLDLLQNLIAKNGGIEMDQLVDAPFTSLNAEGIFGLFPNDGQREDLLSIVRTFKKLDNNNQQNQETP